MSDKKNISDLFWNKVYSIPWVTQLWAKLSSGSDGQSSKTIPFTPLQKPLNKCNVVLITTGGTHLPGQEPFDMKNPEGDASYREIPADVDTGELVITHKYYDHRDADKDVNIILPLDRFRELVGDGIVGQLAPRHYGFMGHIEGDQLPILTERTAPEVANKLVSDQVDVALLTPA